MARFSLTITRTYETVVEVDAANAADARAQVEAYGLTEACSDMAKDDRLVVERIKRVVRA